MTSNLNPLAPPSPAIDHPEHKIHIRLVKDPLQEGSTLRYTLVDCEKNVGFDTYWHSWETYQDVFRTVGFQSWKLEPYVISEEERLKYPPGFWGPYLAAPWVIQFTCKKALLGEGDSGQYGGKVVGVLLVLRVTRGKPSDRLRSSHIGLRDNRLFGGRLRAP